MVEDAFEIFEDTKVRDEFRQAFEKLDEIEVIQLLSDLKYLPRRAFDDGILDDSEKNRAIQRFREEYLEALSRPDSSNLDEIQRESEIIEEEEELVNALTLREVFVLKEITGLDNELIIHDIEKNQSSLLSRVLLYRYRVYDCVSDVFPNHKLTSTVIQKLEKSAREIGFKGDWLAFGNLLANQQKLSAFCVSSPVLTNNVFGDCIFIMTNSNDGREVIKELGGSIKRKRRFLRTVASDAAKNIVSDFIYHNKPDEVIKEVKKYLKLKPNVFMRRVLQVKLWTMGLYQGRLDHDFGPLSIKALSDFLMTIIDNPNKGKEELGKILYNLRRDPCIVNINYLLRAHFIPVEMAEQPMEQSSVSQIFDFVLAEKMSVQSFKVKQRVEIKQETKDLTSSLKTELQNESKEIIQGETHTRRRQYKAKKGIMKFFSKLFKFLKNAYTKLKKLFEKLFRLIKKVTSIIYNEIREAFQNFKHGLKFLFGKRIVKPTPFITTDYDFDFDGVTRIHAMPSTEDIEMHTKTIKRYSSAVYPTLNFVRIVIKWGLRFATGPIGWVKILVGIAKLFKEMLIKRARLELT